MSEPAPGIVGNINLDVPGLLAAGGLVVALVRRAWTRRRRERTRQEMRDRVLILTLETTVGVLAILSHLPCVGIQTEGASCEDRLSEEERQHLAILRHDLEAVRAGVAQVWPPEKVTP